MEGQLISEVWCGAIEDGLRILKDVKLSASHDVKVNIPREASLSFLSLVDVHSIPLHLIAGPSLHVETQSPGTAEWFEQLLTETELSSGQHVSTSLGILAQVKSSLDEALCNVPITELLFYIHVSYPRIPTPPTPPPSSPVSADQTQTPEGSDDQSYQPQYSILALPLSSTMNKMLSIPPVSPSAADGSPHFLPSIETCLQLEQESKKRKRIVDVLDEAAESQRKSRRHQFGSRSTISATPSIDAINILVPKRKKVIPVAAADVKDSPTLPCAISRRHSSVPSDTRKVVPTPNASLSSMTRTRSPSRNSIDMSKMRRTSTLSRVMSAASDLTDTFPEAEDLETRNKEVISRAVMTGLRFYGLQSRRKAGHLRKGSSGSFKSPGPTSAGDDAKRETDEAQEDEEYRTVYHQTYRGVICAYRHHMNSRTLTQQPEALQDTVDSLLAVFCRDPFAERAEGFK